MSELIHEYSLVQAIKSLTFSIGIATEEIKYDIQKEETRDKHTSPKYIWRTSGDGKVRSRHAKFDGQIFSWDNPPEGGYHPGEDYNCRCWAEPYEFENDKLREYVIQTVTSAVNDKFPSWTREDFFHHYNNEKGRMVRLSEIGHLQNIIDHAKSYNQGGGTIFERVEKDVFKKAHENGVGSFPYYFRNSYEFEPVVFEIGGATVSGSGMIHAINKGNFWIINANVDYAFSDEFTRPYDYYDIDMWPLTVNTGEPYHITDKWSTKIEAVIRK